MIRGMHAMFYSSEAEALRAFLRDKLGLKGTDVGGGWLIFDAPEADLRKGGGVEFTAADRGPRLRLSSPSSRRRAISRCSCTRRSTRSSASA